MDTDGGRERDYTHVTNGQRGQEGRSNCEPEVKGENGRNQSREFNGRAQSRESERNDQRGEQECEDKKYEKTEEGHHDRQRELEQRENSGYCNPYQTQRRPRHRDLRHTNYAFSGPHVDAAEKEAQEWFDNLSIAAQEEKNKPITIWPKGRKYRSGDINASPQMLERLQKCEENQETHNYGETLAGAAFATTVPAYMLSCIQVPLTNRGYHLRKSIDLAVRDGPVRKNLKKYSRNHLKEHRAAITEMSAMTHFYKQKENEEEAKRQAAVKGWDGSNCPKKKFPKQIPEFQDFVERNKEAVKELSQNAREEREHLDPDYSFMYHKGKLPKYLRQRKKELLEEVEERGREEVSQPVPDRRRMMSEAERLQTLANLEQRYEELIKVLKSFPLAYDTAHQIKIRAEVEQELKEIETSHSYYGNPKIYLAESPLTSERTSHSRFPLLDQPSEVYHENDNLQRTVSPSAVTHTIPMTYCSSRCETCHAPMQRVIKAPESRKPLRCTACTLKARTRNRSLWSLHKPVKHRTPNFSR
ncbi:hypothetical protein R1flu_002106 [Riccia fluitans]|uniref:Enkurin domain-containing protein n=1 Tax=Riccia fluitans TaxID=41844 RepID=A0ABD1Y5K7_9MARC